tara:strand:+ start:271 stop:828 length:558 start_codon:yes stop_codon:yes gene_type:complete
MRFTIIKNKLSYIKKINYEDFLQLEITKSKKRFQHLNLLTNNMKYIKIKDIINYISLNQNKFKIEERKFQNIINNGNPKENSIHFWSKGNNLLYYNCKYQFRKNVIEYQKFNFYINSIPNLYSKEYYSNLEIMDDKEIQNFLYHNYLFIYKKNLNELKHGFHRIFAMIGRLIDKKEYIPFYAAIL